MQHFRDAAIPGFRDELIRHMAGVGNLLAQGAAQAELKPWLGGAALSAGQRQRIGLARALYGKPVFVVLDEPNSNLDAEGEAAVIHAVKAMKEAGTSVVVIAHRPSAIEAVDKILFIREATQLAFGPRQEVLDKILQSRAPKGQGAEQ